MVEISRIAQDKKINGRQIRNHVMTASALATKSGKPAITVTEIQKIISVSNEFVVYMEDSNEADNDTIATEMGLRLPGTQMSKNGKL